MTMPVAGNAVVANFLMRFPVLIPVVAAVGIAVVAAPTPSPTPTPTPLAIVQPAPPPAPSVLKMDPPRPIEVVCPPVKETSKLTRDQKIELVKKGCKIKG